MTVSFGSVQFDRVRYDAEADVLYLSVEGAQPTLWQESAEGHVLRFDADGQLCGLTLIDARHQLETEGRVRVTPCSQELRSEDIGKALQPA